METEHPEGAVAESKILPAPPADQMRAASSTTETGGLSKSIINSDVFAVNSLTPSSLPGTTSFDLPSTSSSAGDVHAAVPAVNGIPHHRPLVNGNGMEPESMPTPPATSSGVNATPDPPTQPPHSLDTTSGSEDIKPTSPPPTFDPPTSDIPTAETYNIERHSEPAELTAAESQPATRPTGETSAPSASGMQKIPPSVETVPESQREPPQISSEPAIPPPAPFTERETSELRQGTEAITLDETAQIMEDKHQADLAADPELAERLAASGTAPISPTLSEPKPSDPHDVKPAVGDEMDVTMETDIKAHDPISGLPHRPQDSIPDVVSKEIKMDTVSAPAPPVGIAQADQEMQDAPPPSTKVSREREDDTQDDERVVKRSKTDEVESSTTGFKVPELPPHASHATGNGAVAEAVPAEAPAPMTTTQQKHVLKAIQSIKRSKEAAPFTKPVDPVALGIPHYFDHIKHPMDLSTMEKKLKDNVYASLAQVIVDFDLIVLNCLTFNGTEHLFSKQAQNMRVALDKHLVNLPKTDTVAPTAAEKKAQKTAAPKPTPSRRESRSGAPNPRSPANNAASPTTFALNPEGVPLIRRDSTAADGRPKREIHPPRNRGLDYGASKPKKKKFIWELKFCQHVLEELMKPRYQQIAIYFYNPVDPVALNIPDYHKTIKKPMDLGTVGNKLKHGQYENSKEFEADVRLIFKNCYKFNLAGDQVWTAGKALEAEFDREWEKKRKWISDNAPNSNPQSQGTSPDPEDDDDDNATDDDDNDGDDDGDNELSILQKQIAAMSKQVEMIQKKKTSPPATGKKAKNKPGKKETKKPSAPPTSKGNKKALGKAGKPEKIPYVTYEQKKLISDRINDLSETKMSQALKIIRENVPHLKDVNEEEIELDIDELPNEVLWRLLQFVQTGTTYKHDGADSDSGHRRKPPAHAGPPKPKKNKPMGKQEQEAQISSIQAKLAKFDKAGSNDAGDAIRSIEQGSSSDDDASDESEEE